MKNFHLRLIMLLLVFSVLFSGCSSKLADISDNIKYVDTTYQVLDLNEAENRLSKTAELAYTKMIITPKTDVTIKSFSFKAKLKEKDTESTFNLKIYITNPDSLPNKASSGERVLMEDYKITITDQEKTFLIQFAEPCTINLPTDVLLKTDILCIEFLQGTEKNTKIVFTLNDINLLE